jgi:anti-sigma regulatory factor (Ser/Thr protein kinase)
MDPDPTLGSPSLELELERSVRAPSIARSAISERMLEMGIDGAYGQTLVLLVSEVVSNAVRHSTGSADAAIKLVATVTAETIRVAVTDSGEGFTPRPRDPERLEDGYGLYLLEKAASRWGVEHSGGTTVWFEVSRSPAVEG